MTDKPKPQRLIKKTYLAVIKNSVGSKMFKNFYVIENGKEFDAMKSGELSCAFFVSSVLKLFDFISGIHGTVDGLKQDLVKSDWQEIKKPNPGAVIFWKKKDFGGGDTHKHAGFCLGNNQAVSTSLENGWPVKHDWRKDDRKIEAIYWNTKLDSDS